METEIRNTFQCITWILDTVFLISSFILTLNEALLELVRLYHIGQEKQYQHDKDWF